MANIYDEMYDSIERGIKKLTKKSKTTKKEKKQLSQQTQLAKRNLNTTQKALNKQVASTKKAVTKKGITPGGNTFSAPNMFTQRNKIISDARAGKAPVLNRNNNANAVTNREKSEAKNVKKYQSYAKSDSGKKQLEKTQETKDYRNVARSSYEVAKANEDYANSSQLKRGLMTFGAPFRGAHNMIFQSDNTISEKTAKKMGMKAGVTLPNYAQQRQKLVSENAVGAGKLINDLGYNVGQQAVAWGINAVAPGVGTTAYTLNAGKETYNQNILEGNEHSKSAVNSMVNSGMELLTGKLLGASAGMFSKTSELEKTLEKAFKPLVKNPTVRKILAGGSGEATEEFVQQMLSPLVDNLTLGTNKKLISPENFKESLYNAVIGFITGGTATGIHVDMEPQVIKNANKVVTKIEQNGEKLSDSEVFEIGNAVAELEYRNQVDDLGGITDEDIDFLAKEYQKNRTMRQDMERVEKEKNTSQESLIAPIETRQSQDAAEQKNQTVPTNQDSIRDNIEQTVQNEQNVRQETEPQKSSLSEAEANELKTLEGLPFDLEEAQEKRLNYLKAKQEGRIKYADLKTNNEYEETKKESYKYRNTEDFDATVLNAAKEFVPGYRNTGRRTKQQWLDIARMVGSNLNAKTSEDLKKYAMQSWNLTRPNQAVNLNRQSAGFVDFKINEWVNEVYKGAGVGEISQNVRNSNQNNWLDNNTKSVYNEINETDLSENIDVIAEISAVPEKEKYLKWVRTPEFFKLDIKEMDRITQAISGDAALKHSKAEQNGTYCDYDGSNYYYTIDNEANYKITKISKTRSDVEEVVNETTTKRTGDYVMDYTRNGQVEHDRNTKSFRDERTNKRNEGISENNRFENDENIANNTKSPRNRELEGTSDSSFSNEKTKANSDMPNNTLVVKYEKGTEVKPSKPLSEDEKVAQILSEKPIQKQTIKEKAQTAKEKIMRELVDKGYVFRRYENKEVYHKYDQILTASGSANYCLGEAQVDLKGNEIGKSLKDIWAPIEKAGKVEDFDLYYYNLLNIDRYQQGKPVFGENWTDEDSRNLVSELESKNPEFKEWAKDVQTYQHNSSQLLVDAGLLSKELKEQFDAQNEYYAKIIRVNSKNKATMTQNMKGINISNTIRTAKGGNQDIMPLMYSMAQQTMEVFDSARWNDFGQELLKTKGGIAEGETLNVDTDEGTTLSTNKNGEDTRVVKDGDTYKMYVYQNGEKVAVELSEAEYEALAKSKFNDPENFIFSAIRNVNGVYRGLLTDKNPLFLFTNFFRDIGDAPFNSKYGGQFVGGYAEAIKQMSSNSELWKKYKGLGGASNSYFDTQKGIDLSKDNTAKKALGAIEKMNMYVEQAPRFAEFLLTLKNGGTESEAMYNAAEVTTNFKRGGDLTKTLNKNGAMFLNASVQGFSKVVRNFTENGAKGATQMLAKACILGVLPSVLNQLSYDDDDDYNDLPDYIKDNYYVFKTDDKKFIRIPKGRAMAVFGMTAQRTINYLNGDKDAFKGLLKNASNNIAPNNPLENNMISPILAVKNNVSWSGSPIVSEYLKNDTYPEYEYDAKTDSLSKAIGKFFGVSPKKVNYLLDQYSGGAGDVLLPLITPQAHVNPISAKFTTNTINSNKNIDKFYTELNSYSDKKRAGLSKDEDQVKYAYLNAVNGDIAELKGQLKEIQADTSLDNKTKLNKVNKLQQEINDRCKFALQDYETGYIESGSYAYIGEKEFYKDSSGSWHKVSTDQQRSYNKYAAKYDITPGEYFSKAKITNDVIAGDKYEEYRNGVENARAKVEGTANKKAATIEYVNNLELDIPQKAMLIRSYYSSFKSYDSDIINYLNENVEDERQRYLIEIQLGIIRK